MTRGRSSEHECDGAVHALAALQFTGFVGRYNSNDVCKGSITSLQRSPHHVRYSPESGNQKNELACRLSANCRHYSIGSAHRLWVLSHLSCGRTTRRLPKLRGRRLPIKRVVAWTVLLQVLNPRDRLLDARAMAGRHPPQHDRRPFKMFKPIGAAAIEARVYCLPDQALPCTDAFPHRKIDDDTRVGIRPRVSGVTALVNIAPDKTGAAFGNAVHQCKIVREICHARVVDFVSNAADVQLRKMMIGWLLQRSYSVTERRDEITPLHTRPQTSKVILAVGIVNGRPRRCPLWVKSRHSVLNAGCPLGATSGHSRYCR